MLKVIEKRRLSQNIFDYFMFYKGVKFKFRTYGSLNQRENNCIIVNHPLSYNIDCIPCPGEKQAWWEHIVGEEKPLNPESYFIVAISFQSLVDYSCNLVSELSLSFNFLSELQDVVMTFLGVKEVFLVVGGSLGGLISLAFGCFAKIGIKNLIIISASYKAFPNQILFRLLLIDLLASYQNAVSDAQLETIRLLSSYVYRDPDTINEYLSSNNSLTDYIFACKKKLPEVAIERYKFFLKMMNQFSLSNKDLEKIRANILALGTDSDAFYTPKQLEELYNILKKLNKNASLLFIQSHKGHDAFLLEQEKFSTQIMQFIEPKTGGINA